MEIQAEQALTADGTRMRQNLAARYGIAATLFIPAVDPLLLAVDDHVLFPLAEEWSDRRWVRVSSLKILNHVCLMSRRVLEDKILMIHIMPYLSLEDAFTIHGFVENRGEIAVPDQLPHMPEAEEEAGSGGLKLPLQGRYGILVVDDPDMSHSPAPPLLVKFFVINYGLLASKAREHERLAALVTEGKDLLRKLNLHMSQLLKGQSLCRVLHPQHMQKVEDKARVAQEEFILSIYMNDIHDKIYEDGYDPCNSNALPYDEIPQDTRARLEGYMDELKASGRNAHHPKHAELEVLAAEGLYDAESVFARASNTLKQTLNNCSEGLCALISDLADSRCSLIGVHGKRPGIVLHSQEGD